MSMQVGDYLPLTIEFKVAGALTDPTSITLTVANPLGVAGTPATYPPGGVIAKDGVGQYHADVQATDPGWWTWRWESTGQASAVYQGRTYVEAAALPTLAPLSITPLATVDEVREHMALTDVEISVPDSEISRLILSASEAINNLANREFGRSPAAQVRTFEADVCWSHMGWQVVWVGDMADVPASVERLDVNGNVMSPAVNVSTGLRLEPVDRVPGSPIRGIGFVNNVPGWSGVQWLRVNAVWGFPYIPESIRQACIETVVMVYDRPGPGRVSQTFADEEPAIQQRGRQLPLSAWDAVRPYREYLVM